MALNSPYFLVLMMSLAAITDKMRRAKSYALDRRAVSLLRGKQSYQSKRKGFRAPFMEEVS